MCHTATNVNQSDSPGLELVCTADLSLEAIEDCSGVASMAYFFFAFAHESRSVTVRLKTGRSSVESLSLQK